jgi:nucleoid-associated protein YgaU
MINRLKYINPSRELNQTKPYFKNLKYPRITLSIKDIYVTTTIGDRLDLLADQFYNDVRLWWVIANANRDIIRRDSFGLKPGLEIRIPSNITKILYDFELINKNSY